jgi:Ser/Thr protein kinase RdoA (MazF antagonist)
VSHPPGDGLVHGLGRDLVAPDWPPVTEALARAVLARHALPGADRARVTWRSPRPLSAAAIVRCGDRELLLKRHDPRVRTAAGLALEHRLGAHLRAGGVPVPAVLAAPPGACPPGATALTLDGGVCELHELAEGVDAYRDAPSWTGSRSADHAVAAGAALARLHRVATGFAAAARPLRPLADSCAPAAAGDPVAVVAALAATRPGLAAGLPHATWQQDLTAALSPWSAAAAAALTALPRHWGHGDWHPSNLTWSDAGAEATVAGVLDLGLANRTTPAWDVAIAIERACVGWLDLDGGEPARADLAAVDALLDGYESVRPLSDAERSALPALAPVVHVAFALSEVEYYAGVLRSPQRAQVAWRDYLIGHCHWFRSPDGAALLTHLRARAADHRRAPSPRR